MQSDSEIDKLWPTLMNELKLILGGSPCTAGRWMEIYTDVCNFCQKKRSTKSATAQLGGEEIYYKLEDFLIKHVESVNRKFADLSGETLLTTYLDEWTNYKSHVKFLPHLFRYLDRYWIPRELDEEKHNVYKIEHLTMLIWKRDTFMHTVQRLTAVILRMIEQERRGININTALIKQVLSSYTYLNDYRARTERDDLKLFDSLFFAAFNDETREFYSRECSEFIAENSISDYLKKVHKRILEETHRTDYYCDQSENTDTLVNTCLKVMVVDYNEKIFIGIRQMLTELSEEEKKKKKKKDLGRCFFLLKKLPQVSDFCKIFEEHIHEEGLQVIQSIHEKALQDPSVFVGSIATLFNNYSELLQKVFARNEKFTEAMEKAFRRFINSNWITKVTTPSKPSELLARYSDGLLKKNTKLAPNEIEEKLSEMVVIFNFLSDKDSFISFYTQSFSKRLISQTSASDNLEELMITKLKSCYGLDCMIALTRMYNDVQLTRELNDEFARYMNDKPIRSTLSFNAMIVTQGTWHLGKSSTEIVFPPDLQSFYDAFEEFYTVRKFAGRRLMWLPQQSHCELRSSAFASSKERQAPYTFVCSAFQAVVLLTFNTGDAKGYRDIKQATGLNDSELKAVLFSLLRPRLLLANPKITADSTADTITDSYRFAVNYRSFKNSKLRIVLHSKSQVEQEEEQQETNSQIQKARKTAIHAMVVRIMKSRKEMDHQSLVSACVSQLESRFKPDISDIKRSIDKLIDSEYLERVDKNKYRYKA